MTDSWAHSQANSAMPRMAGMFPVAIPSTALRVDDQEAARWRRVVLRLSECFSNAAAGNPRLAPFLLEALGNALEQLLLFGRERDLLLLDEWLEEELVQSAALLCN